MTIILGIESSCDETAIALVDDSRRVLANIVRSQHERHAPYGGVVPEIAARAHIEWIAPLLREALAQAGKQMNDVDVIAATAGPGLIGGVMVGLMTGKTLASIHRKPFVAVNHLEGHALTVRLCEEVTFPYLLLLVSGGHCLFALVRGVGRYELLGSTRDDALGEAYDKCAKMMGLPYPGGPQIEKLAASGNPCAYDLPRPMLGTPGCDMSLSGLKTAVRYLLRDLTAGERELSAQEQADVAASFQQAVVDILRERTGKAMEMAAGLAGSTVPLVVAGGVAANQVIGAALREVAASHGAALHVPPPALCTDNAAMIAWAGMERFQIGLLDGLDTQPRARWPLSELSTLSG